MRKLEAQCTKLEAQCTKFEQKLASPSVGSDKQSIAKEKAASKAAEDAKKKSAVSRSIVVVAPFIGLAPEISHRLGNRVSLKGEFLTKTPHMYAGYPLHCKQSLASLALLPYYCTPY